MTSKGTPLAILLRAACGALSAPAPAAACAGIDLAGYFQDKDTGDGNFAARIVTLDSGDPVPGLSIHARVVQLMRGSYRGSQIIIRPAHVSDCDLVPMKGEDGILVGRILEIDDDGVAVIDPLRSETPRQRTERGEDYLRGALPPPVAPSAVPAKDQRRSTPTMQPWSPYRTAALDGELVVEFEGSTQAFISFDRPMSPHDPSDTANEVVMLGMVDGPWSTRDAISKCVAEGKRLLAEAGYDVH